MLQPTRLTCVFILLCGCFCGDASGAVPFAEGGGVQLTTDGLVYIIGEDGLNRAVRDRRTELAHALSKLYEDPDLRNSMGAKGKKFACQHYSLEQAVVKFERELQLLTGSVAPAQLQEMPETAR